MTWSGRTCKVALLTTLLTDCRLAAATSSDVIAAYGLKAFCVQDPGNSHYYLAKPDGKAGWSSGDSCYAVGGGLTPYGGQPCIGGSGLDACLTASSAAGLKAEGLTGFCVQDPGNSHYYLAKPDEEPGWKSGDSCFAVGGGLTPHGDKPCIGGTGFGACLATSSKAGLTARGLGASCVQDPGNSHYYLAKPDGKAGWTSGDSCFAGGGGLAPYGGNPCVGASSFDACAGAAQAVGLSGAVAEGDHPIVSSSQLYFWP